MSESRAAQTPTATHRSFAELEAHLPELDATPKGAGTLELIVARPGLGERLVLEEGELDLDAGLVGDTWSQRSSKRTDDGSPHPDMQLNVMSHPMVRLLAGTDPGVQALAGDQLYLDLDLSCDNLPSGTRLVLGPPDSPAGASGGPAGTVDTERGRGAVIEVTDQPHTGCAKFVDRFGADAMRFVSGREGRRRRLRGLNAKVVTPGRVRRGDRVVVHRPAEQQTEQQ